MYISRGKHKYFTVFIFFYFLIQPSLLVKASENKQENKLSLKISYFYYPLTRLEFIDWYRVIYKKNIYYSINLQWEYNCIIHIDSDVNATCLAIILFYFILRTFYLILFVRSKSSAFVSKWNIELYSIKKIPSWKFLFIQECSD